MNQRKVNALITASQRGSNAWLKLKKAEEQFRKAWNAASDEDRAEALARMDMPYEVDATRFWQGLGA